MAEVMGNEPHTDPDAQATVTDFIDYTEHLPSDVRRSLALIEKLNAATRDAQHKVHELTKQWNAGAEASDGATAYQVAKDLRARISYQKNLSSRYATAALAEANRMDEEISRHQKLLSVTAVKLDALPLPPSRDPTPQPVLQSPQAVRNAAMASGPSIKLRLGLSSGRVSGLTRPGQGGAPRSRRKRVIVPGEVLPPPNPDSPTPSDFSESESPEPIRLSPKIEPRTKVEKASRIKIPKPPRVPKSDMPKMPKKERVPRPAGVMGTNVHSQVAGISTSNALAKLTPPPADAPKGGEHAPWMRLTEYEMAKLRKRMKKNAIWAPSDTMIRRELTDAGRGPEAYRKAKQLAEETDSPFVDCDDLANKDPSVPLVPGEIPLETVKTKLINKGMSLNVQKKEKKELIKKQLAEQVRLEAEQAASRLGQIGLSFKNLFDRSNEGPLEKIVVETPASKKRKRKRDSMPASAASATEDNQLQNQLNYQLNNQLHSEIILTPSASAKPSKRAKKAPSTTPVPLATKPSASPSLPTPTGLAAPSLASTSVSISTNNNKPATLNSTSNTKTTTIPLAAAAPSPIKSPLKPPTTASAPTTSATNAIQQPQPSPTKPPNTRRLSLVIKPPASPGPDTSAPPTSTTARPTSARPPSRPASRRASVGPPPEPAIREQRSLRRKSATPGAPATTTTTSSAVGAGPSATSAGTSSSATGAPGTSAPSAPTAASRRAKRPAPGPVQNGEQGGSAISVGKRSRRPAKKGGNAAAAIKGGKATGVGGKDGEKGGDANAAGQQGLQAEEDIDPNEPRYCVCGDVSYGTMVLCENVDCEKEWFHLECVGLPEIPPRRTKWWCPDCKKKLGMEP